MATLNTAKLLFGFIIVSAALISYSLSKKTALAEILNSTRGEIKIERVLLKDGPRDVYEYTIGQKLEPVSSSGESVDWDRKFKYRSIHLKSKLF